jgi:predicted DNA-binding transcriptional regulator AlpA
MKPILLLPEAAERLHTSPETLRYWRHAGTGPKSFKMGRRVCYFESEIDNWLEERAAAAVAS